MAPAICVRGRGRRRQLCPAAARGAGALAAACGGRGGVAAAHGLVGRVEHDRHLRRAPQPERAPAPLARAGAGLPAAAGAPAACALPRRSGRRRRRPAGLRLGRGGGGGARPAPGIWLRSAAAPGGHLGAAGHPSRPAPLRRRPVQARLRRGRAGRALLGRVRPPDGRRDRAAVPPPRGVCRTPRAAGSRRGWQRVAGRGRRGRGRRPAAADADAGLGVRWARAERDGRGGGVTGRVRRRRLWGSRHTYFYLGLGAGYAGKPWFELTPVLVLVRALRRRPSPLRPFLYNCVLFFSG
eukprot:scaffold11070_cov92-Isochrysis_galbana.AAC.2